MWATIWLVMCLPFFLPFKRSWLQPIGWYASKGATRYTNLPELIFKAMRMLFRCGATFKYSVCDGCSCNKAALETIGVNGKTTNHSIIYPIDNSTKVLFFIEVPHLIKFTRNYFMNHGTAQVRYHASSVGLVKRYPSKQVNCLNACWFYYPLWILRIHLHHREKQTTRISAIFDECSHSPNRLAKNDRAAFNTIVFE